MNDWGAINSRVLCMIGLWSGAVALVLIGRWYGEPFLGQLGIIASAGAATLQVRGYFTRYGDAMRNAYDLGRDAAASRHRDGNIYQMN